MLFLLSHRAPTIIISHGNQIWSCHGQAVAATCRFHLVITFRRLRWACHFSNSCPFSYSVYIAGGNRGLGVKIDRSRQRKGMSLLNRKRTLIVLCYSVPAGQRLGKSIASFSVSLLYLINFSFLAVRWCFLKTCSFDSVFPCLSVDWCICLLRLWCACLDLFIYMCECTNESVFVRLCVTTLVRRPVWLFKSNLPAYLSCLCMAALWDSC